MVPEVFKALVEKRNTRGAPRALAAAELYLLGHAPSVRKAAAEVDVCHSAASRMVRELEDEYSRLMDQHGLTEVKLLVPEERTDDARHFAARLRHTAQVPETIIAGSDDGKPLDVS
ncbi:hypothetical protein [Halomonas sp. I5-271120]|uniref:hypothetical protein n=1 Tax=Halomonas sp. I5-271120 TaxID=3061632 RepID=UPI002714D212|nr:hypothetical protein [Halomonas sp. I5-271120]